MRTFLTLIFILFASFLFAQNQPSHQWTKWNYLVGEWKGNGKGNPGTGTGIFRFSLDLDNQVLIRNSETEFPASEGKAAVAHKDLLIVYPESGIEKAIYFDNEGHVIHYTIGYENRNIILTSEKMEGMPVFRLSYIFKDEQTVIVRFEMSQDGKNFINYLEGESQRVQ